MVGDDDDRPGFGDACQVIGADVAAGADLVEAGVEELIAAGSPPGGGAIVQPVEPVHGQQTLQRGGGAGRKDVPQPLGRGTRELAFEQSVGFSLNRGHELRVFVTNVVNGVQRAV